MFCTVGVFSIHSCNLLITGCKFTGLLLTIESRVIQTTSTNDRQWKISNWDIVGSQIRRGKEIVEEFFERLTIKCFTLENWLYLLFEDPDTSKTTQSLHETEAMGSTYPVTNCLERRFKTILLSTKEWWYNTDQGLKSRKVQFRKIPVQDSLSI